MLVSPAEASVLTNRRRENACRGCAAWERNPLLGCTLVTLLISKSVASLSPALVPQT